MGIDLSYGVEEEWISCPTGDIDTRNIVKDDLLLAQCHTRNGYVLVACILVSETPCICFQSRCAFLAIFNAHFQGDLRYDIEWLRLASFVPPANPYVEPVVSP